MYDIFQKQIFPLFFNADRIYIFFLFINILKLHVEHVLIPQEFEYENFIFAEMYIIFRSA